MRDAIWLGFAIGCGFAGFIAGIEWSTGWLRKHGKRSEPKHGITIIDHRTPEQIAWAMRPENLHKAWRDGWTPS